MKKFFINQWNNFKKYWYFYLLWFILIPFVFDFIAIGFDLIRIDFGSSSFFYPAECYSFLDNAYGVLGCFCLLISYILNEFCLYLYSYYIYTGKNNSYKFFRERKKLHKKEDEIAYKEYLDKNKKEMMKSE